MTSNDLSESTQSQECRPGAGATRSCGPAARLPPCSSLPPPYAIHRNEVPHPVRAGTGSGPDQDRGEYLICAGTEREHRATELRRQPQKEHI